MSLEIGEIDPDVILVCKQYSDNLMEHTTLKQNIEAVPICVIMFYLTV